MSPICDTDWTRATLRKNKAIQESFSSTPSPTAASSPLPSLSSPPIPPARKKRNGKKMLNITEIDCTSDHGGSDSEVERDGNEDDFSMPGYHLATPQIFTPTPTGRKQGGHLAFRGFKLSKVIQTHNIKTLNIISVCCLLAN